MHQDTFFLNSAEALRVAQEENRFGDNKNFLQACYYDGEPLSSDLVNLIHLPIENLLESLALGFYRIPQKIDFSGLELSHEIEQQIRANFNQTIEHAKKYRVESNLEYFHTIIKAEPNFEEPLRFYLMASSKTDVLQYVSKSIAETLKNLGYEVLFKLYHGIEDMNYLKDMVDFNPHVQININHLHNHYLNESIFNMVWIQDPVALVTEKTNVKIRKRDYFFTLVKEFEVLLQKKGISSTRQSFCVNTKEYKLDTSITREKKIVFIGSSYTELVNSFGDIPELINYISQAFQNGDTFSDSKIEEISQTFGVKKVDLTSFIIPYVIRDVSVILLCNIKSQYKVEIYGKGWDVYESVKPYYKGMLNYGADIAKVYNSATFAFAPHPEYILQQRVFEAAACGAIPLLYDCRELTDEGAYEEAIVYFKTQEDLENILHEVKPTKKEFTRLLRENSYEDFVQKIIKIIKDETHG